MPILLLALLALLRQVAAQAIPPWFRRGDLRTAVLARPTPLFPRPHTLENPSAPSR